VRPPDLRLDKLRAALVRRRAASSPTPRRSAQRLANQPTLAPELLWYAGVLRAATVTIKLLHQSAVRSHTRAQAGRAGASCASASQSLVKHTKSRGRAKQGAGRTSQSPYCRLLSWASPWSLTWDGVSGALLAEAALSRLLQDPPACRGMQPVWPMATPGRACAEVATACKEKEKKIWLPSVCQPGGGHARLSECWPGVLILKRCAACHTLSACRLFHEARTH